MSIVYTILFRKTLDHTLGYFSDIRFIISIYIFLWMSEEEEAFDDLLHSSNFFSCRVYESIGLREPQEFEVRLHDCEWSLELMCYIMTVGIE